MIIIYILIGVIIGYLLNIFRYKIKKPDALFIKNEEGVWTLDMQRDIETLQSRDNLKVSVYLL